MLRDEGYEEPNLLAYPSLLIQMSSFCFTTLHEFRRILLRQFGKMDFDIEDMYVIIIYIDHLRSYRTGTM